LTDDGDRLVTRVVPFHLRSVRELVLDPLTAADTQALTRIAAKLRVVPPDFA
jgi:hypothetical protein